MPARRRQHQLDLEAHKQKLIRLKAEYRQPEKVVAFRRKRLCEVLKHTLPHDGEDSRAIEGANEHRLRHRLEHFFHGRIYTRLTVSIPNYEYPYSPDITYIDTTLGLYIDIEVDEPYDYYSGQPTHELNGEKDARRDQFFLRRGGIVIRFSEEQVVCASESCCKEVAKTIASLTGDPTIPAQFENVPDLVSMPQWTYTEAAEMALNRVRDRGYECRNFPQSVPRTSGISPASGSTLTPDELLNRLTESMRQRRSQAESSRRVRSQQQDRSSLPTPPAPNSQTFNTQPPKNPPTVQSRSPVQPPSDAQRPTKKTPPVQPNNSENRGRSWRRNRRKKLKMKLANSQTTESEARGYIQTALELGVIEQNEFSKFMDYFINRDNNNA
ncbi:MAG: hypothetical protein J0L70_11330 [Leptolyngbya sp. UWPOB_LEPTO1]|uniref:hypothetical protein n=1 Tax=Leptolyngbya sp. UWPOB_LEPTO1 TaxID=2815653 RepID=UPI001AC572DD|nr:hypothetical protein [Leptolyngbya sp. UWPOB_LEPTO1]MBN8561108.1 hypothetical protein [Leptolyngbya sp. UWPOB_LEPTO1]